MIERVQVKSFRGLTDLTIEGLGQINVLGGENNVGKTTVLEALYLLLSAQKPEAIMAINSARATLGYNLTHEIVDEYMWRPLFARVRPENPVELTAEEAGGGKYRLKIALDPSTSIVGETPGRFHPGLRITYALPGKAEAKVTLVFQAGSLGAMTSDLDFLNSGKPCILVSSTTKPSFQDVAERFGSIELKGGTDRLVEAMRMLEPDLTALKTIVRAGIPMIWAELKHKFWVPAYFLGEGSVRLGLILMSILDAGDGIVLVDEFENGIHHSHLQRAWEIVGAACASVNAQLVATTHSLECITSAERALASSPGVFRYLRIDRSGDLVTVKQYDPEVLEAAIETDLEVR
ncbi:MAG: AAA family ATPase [Candidatus Xenobia bacterium]